MVLRDSIIASLLNLEVKCLSFITTLARDLKSTMSWVYLNVIKMANSKSLSKTTFYSIWPATWSTRGDTSSMRVVIYAPELALSSSPKTN